MVAPISDRGGKRGMENSSDGSKIVPEYIPNESKMVPKSTPKSTPNRPQLDPKWALGPRPSPKGTPNRPKSIKIDPNRPKSIFGSKKGRKQTTGFRRAPGQGAIFGIFRAGLSNPGGAKRAETAKKTSARDAFFFVSGPKSTGNATKAEIVVLLQ